MKNIKSPKTNEETSKERLDSTLSSEDEQPFYIRYYLRIVNEHKWSILLFFLVVVGGATVWTLRQVPVYQATSTVQVELNAPSVLGREVEQVEELGTGSFWNNQEYLKTQYKIIQSRKVALMVVDSLHLDEDPYFVGEGENQRTKVEIADYLRSKVSVSPVRESRLILISASDIDPERARDLSNTIADAYISQNSDRRVSATNSALDWLAGQQKQLSQELERSERDLYQFRKNRDILSVSLEDRQNILANEIQKLSDAQTLARTRRIELGSKVAEVEKLSRTDPLNMPDSRLIDNPLLQTLKGRYSELVEKKASMSKRYGRNWEPLKQIDGELVLIRESISREVDSVLKSMKSEFRAAQRTEVALGGALADAQKKALELNLHEIEYNQLLRKYQQNEKMHELVLGRTKETGLAARLDHSNNLRILDYAIVPVKPISPRVGLNLLIAAFFGLIGGIGLAFLLDMLDVTVKNQSDIERMGAICLGVVPSMELSREKRRRKRKGQQSKYKLDLFVHEYPKSTVAESCRSIRTNIMFMSPETEIKTLLITSPGPREGKTTVAASLAVVMAQGGAKVVIVDTDMRRPRVHKAFELPRGTGVSSIIMDQSTIDESIQETQVKGVYVLSCGPVPPNPAELIHTERFANLVSDLQERFDRVILDSPPLGAVTDAAILGRMADGVVLVSKSGATRKEGLRHSLRQMIELDSNVLGVVLNDVDISKRNYGYYNYYYYRGKGHYYGHYTESPGSDGEEDSHRELEERKKPGEHAPSP